MLDTLGQYRGLPTRISTRKNAHPSQQSARLQSIWIDALPIAYNHAGWEKRFLANWPEGSAAWESYYRRIVSGGNPTSFL
ncbi:MAG: hypothetical protein IPL70_05280 [Uliginosibacterium sp.]|nr:hypothetical protein [Uliginosibacterium sp.]